MTIPRQELLSQSLLEAAPDAIIILGPDRLIEIVNAQTQTLFGYVREELVGREIEILVPERFRDGHPALRDGFRAQPTIRPMGLGLELFGRRKNGSEFPVEISLSPMGPEDDLRVVCIVRDVTLQKQTQEAVQRNLELLQAVVEGTSDRIFIKDLQGRYRLINSAGAQLIGLEPQIILGKDDSQVYPPATARRLMALDQEVMTGGEAITAEEEVSVLNRKHIFLSTKVPLRDSTGAVTGLVGVSQDITERKSAEDQLRSSEEKLRLLIEGIRDYAVIMLDPAGCIQSWNEAGERITGYRTAEVLGRHCSLLYTREAIDLNEPEVELRAAASLGNHHVEGLRARRDGSRFLASVVTVPLLTEDGNLRGYSQVFQDVTQKRQLEEEHERFLAASNSQEGRERIAMELHDGVIQSLYGLSLMLEAMGLELRQADMDVLSKRMVSANSMLSQSIRDIRSFVMELRPAVTEPEQLPSELSNLALAISEGAFAVDVSIPSDLPALSPSQVQCIYRVTQEALNNVRKHTQASRVTVSLWFEAESLRLEVADNGAGFDSRIRRPDGQGLLNMHKRADDLQGQLTINSSPSHGTRVTLVLPRS